MFLLPVEKALGATRSEISATYSIYMIVNGFAAPFAGQLLSISLTPGQTVEGYRTVATIADINELEISANLIRDEEDQSTPEHRAQVASAGDEEANAAGGVAVAGSGSGLALIGLAGRTKQVDWTSLWLKEINVQGCFAYSSNERVRGRVVRPFALALAMAMAGEQGSDALRDELIKLVRTEIGPIAKPNKGWIVPDMPKTRSGKIMRRVLAAISNHTDVGDVTTLANPEIVESIKNMVQS